MGRGTIPAVTLLSQSALLAAVISGTLGVYHGQRRGLGPNHSAFALLCTALALRYMATFVVESFEVGIRWETAHVVLGLAVPPLALAFFRQFLHDDAMPGGDRLARLGAVASEQQFTSTITGLAFTAVGRSGWVRALQWIYSFGVLYACAALVNWRLATEDSRIRVTRLRYLLVGHVVTVTFTALDFLVVLDVPFLTVGNAVAGIYLYLLSQALLRHRLLDMQELMGKAVVLGLLAVVLATIYTLLVVWVGDQPALMVFNSLVASIVILVLFDPLRTMAERRLGPLLFGQKFEFERRLLALRTELAGTVEVPSMALQLMKRLELTRRVTHAGLWLLGTDGVSYRRMAYSGPPPPVELPMPGSMPLLELVDKEGVLVLEDLHDRIRDARRREAVGGHTELANLEGVAAAMDELHSGVIVPLKGRDGLLGLISVKDDRLYEAYSYDEIGRMAEVARQVALTVENSRIYDSIRERDRLAVLGEMSAGLAHEVRNPLGAIKGAAQVLQSRATGAGSLSDPMLDVIVEEVDRLDVVVSRFLDYARPMNVAPAPTDLNDLVQRMANALRASPLSEGVQVKVAALDELPDVMADDEMLGGVLVNLGRNALEASGHAGTVTISTRRFRGRPVGVSGSVRPELGWAELRVSDDGEGMSDEAMRHLFIPFYTTKEGGTGLGLAISQRVVRNLGGAIDVRSKKGKGSTFIVYLPLAPAPGSAGGGDDDSEDAVAGAAPEAATA